VKILRLIAGAAAVLFLCCCEQPVRPAVEGDVLEYSIDCSDNNLLADIKYRDSSNSIVSLSGQALPWSVAIELVYPFSGDAFLTVEVSQAQVFVPFVSGTADPVPEIKKLNDADKDFISAGVIAGDKIYIDSQAIEYAEVDSVTDSDTLFLNTDLFSSGSESYSIYHTKTLRSVIAVNDVVAEEVTVESEKLLSSSVVAVIDY